MLALDTYELCSALVDVLQGSTENSVDFNKDPLLSILWPDSNYFVSPLLPLEKWRKYNNYW